MSKDEKMNFGGMQISLVSNISHYYFNSFPVAPCSNNKIIKYTVAIFVCWSIHLQDPILADL